MQNGTVSWEVRATFSHPMQNASLRLDMPGGGTMEVDMYPEGDERLEYTAPVPTETVRQLFQNGTLDQNLIFSGTSTEGDPVIEMYGASNGLSDCVKVPVLNPESCEWEPSPAIYPLDKDKSHTIEIACVPLQIDFSTEVQYTFCISSDIDPQRIESIAWIYEGSVLVSGGSAQVPNLLCYEYNPEKYGEYCVVITTTDGCVAKQCAEYCKRPSGPSITFVEEAPCAGQNTGSLMAVPVEGAGFEWDAGGLVLNNIPAGEYCGQLVHFGCDLIEAENPGTVCYTLNAVDSAPLTYSLGEVQGSCGEMELGSACIQPIGGAGPYTISWENGNEGSCANELPTGCISFTITDNCGNSLTDCVEIPEVTPEPPVVELNKVYRSCSNLSSGGINFTIEQGVAPFTFRLTHPPTGTTYVSDNGVFTDIPAGPVYLNVVDGCGQTHYIGDYEIPAYTFTAELDITDYCSEEQPGSISVTNIAFDGSFHGAYAWSNGATTSTITGLAPGSYSVTITETNTGCTIVREGVVANSFEQAPQFTVIPGSSSVGARIYVTDPSGGAWHYEWSNGREGTYVEGIEPGTYTVRVTNEQGCERKYDVVVADCDREISISRAESRVTPLTGTAENPGGGAIDLVVNGAPSEDLSFEWRMGFPTPSGNYDPDFVRLTEDLTNLNAGTYCVTVTDKVCGKEVNHCFRIIEECSPLRISLRQLSGCIDTEDPSANKVELAGISSSGPEDWRWYRPSYARVDWSTGFSRVVNLDDNGRPNPSHTISGFTGTVSVSVVDEYGCTGTGTATYLGYANCNIYPGWTTADEISNTFNEDEASELVTYEFRGNLNCGWVDDGNGAYIMNSRGGQSDYQRAKFVPNTEMPGANDCQRGGEVIINTKIEFENHSVLLNWLEILSFGTLNFDGDAVDCSTSITIPPNTSAIEVSDNSNFVGCVFPKNLFEYPYQTIYRPGLEEAHLFAEIYTPPDNGGESMTLSFTNRDGVPGDCGDCASYSENTIFFPPEEGRCPIVEVTCTEEGHEFEGQVTCESDTPIAECKCFATLAGSRVPDNNSTMIHVSYCAMDPSIPITTPRRSVGDSRYNYVLDLPYCSRTTQDPLNSNDTSLDDCFLLATTQPLMMDDTGREYTPAPISISQLQSNDTEQQGEVLNKIYPNPTQANGEIRIALDLKRSQVLNIRVHDISGNQLIQMVQKPHAGESTIVIPLRGDFKPGIYFATVVTNTGKTETLRFVIVD